MKMSVTICRRDGWWVQISTLIVQHFFYELDIVFYYDFEIFYRMILIVIPYCRVTLESLNFQNSTENDNTVIG
jgi:hypothetical protein